jgi:ATP-binding cassette subfamily F protein 3
MREKAEELEEEMVDVRKEDRTIKAFTIPVQQDINGDIITINSFTTMNLKNGKLSKRKVNLKIKKNQHLLLKGPNGIGKSTLLEHLANNTSDGAKILEGIRVGYYRQDFSTLNFEHTVYQSLASAMLAGGLPLNEEHMRATAASFLITGEFINTKIESLSEGQKGLVAFARLVLERPGLLILDEPTNHINFRHIPVIAEAINQYKGALVLVSHVPEFVAKIRIDEILDLDK